MQLRLLPGSYHVRFPRGELVTIYCFATKPGCLPPDNRLEMLSCLSDGDWLLAHTIFLSLSFDEMTNQLIHNHAGKFERAGNMNIKFLAFV
jgi:hypothetical protein